MRRDGVVKAPWTWGGHDGVAFGRKQSGTLGGLVRADRAGGMTR